MESTSAERQTHPNDKPHIIIRNNERVTCMLIDTAFSEDRCDQESSREDSKTLQ
jgi:hypothetical protein